MMQRNIMLHRQPRGATPLLRKPVASVADLRAPKVHPEIPAGAFVKLQRVYKV